MATTRWSEGGTTVVLHGDLESYVRRAMEATAGAAVRAMEDAAEEVAVKARGEWYQRVDRQTGLSGQIDVVTTVSDKQVRVAVGSVDDRRDKTGKPVAVYVHEPRPTSTVRVKVAHAEWWRRKAAGLPVREYPYALEPNPKAAAGKYLLETLIKAPMRRRLKDVAPDILAKLRATGVPRG